MAKLNTVNVVEVAGGVINSIRSFSDDEEGNKEAEVLFKLVALENGAKEEDVDSYIENAHFEIDDYDLLLTHSNN